MFFTPNKPVLNEHTKNNLVLAELTGNGLL